MNVLEVKIHLWSEVALRLPCNKTEHAIPNLLTLPFAAHHFWNTSGPEIVGLLDKYNPYI